MKLNDKQIDVLYINGWTYNDESESECEFQFYSKEGEDISFVVPIKENHSLSREVYRYGEDFDDTEHALMWYGANRGEPSDLRTLLEDAEDIKKTILDMAMKLWEVE